MNSRESFIVYDAVNKELGRKYPYLRLSLPGGGSTQVSSDGCSTGVSGHEMFQHTIDMSDSVRVIDLESALRQLIGAPVQTLRKNGSIWLKISHTNHWTLKEQNDRGRELDV